MHDAQVAFDCIALGNLDRAHTNTLTARAAVDAAETMLRVALSGAGTVVDTGADGADEADEAVDAQPDEAFEAFGPGPDEAFDNAGASAERDRGERHEDAGLDGLEGPEPVGGLVQVRVAGLVS